MESMIELADVAVDNVYDRMTELTNDRHKFCCVFDQHGKVETFTDILNALQINVLFQCRVLGSELRHATLHVQVQGYVRGRNETTNSQSSSTF